MANALEVRGLSKRYPAFALSDVGFSIPEGYIMGFIGPNGAGKTTTIKAILSMIAPDAGEVSFFGQDMQEAGPARNDALGVVMDLPFYPDDWRVAEVGKALAPFYSKWDAALFDKRLHAFQLDKDKRIKELSRGMKVKLMLAAALSHGAKLLILDEPTSGLDPVARDELMDLLLEFVQDGGHSVLFSTHITTDLERVADYITFIQQGKIVFTGEKDALLSKYARITGGLDALTSAVKGKVIGLRTHGAGFEGMILTEDMRGLPASVLTEAITLDALIVYMNKAGISGEIP